MEKKIHYTVIVATLHVSFWFISRLFHIVKFIFGISCMIRQSFVLVLGCIVVA